MKSKLMERPLMGGVVRQAIDSEMLCLTDLTNIFETERVKNGWREKQISKFFENKHEIEYITELLDLQGVFIDSKKLLFTDIADNQGAIKALKAIGQYKMKGRGNNRAIYVNPYIFIAVAQWLNPRFRAFVTIWATDQLILNRIEAGAGYSELCESIHKHIVPSLSDNGKRFIFSNFSKLLNKYVFGRHDDNLRQIASKEQLSKMNKIETQIAVLIKVGHIKSYQEAKDYIETLSN